MGCDSPITVRPKNALNAKGQPQDTDKTVPVPCGQCPPCKKSRVASWTFRLFQEEKIAMSTYFVTLTYDSINIPISPNSWMTLNMEHLTLFYKQLRIQQSRNLKMPSDWPKIKYYSAGEYGTIRGRPHFHIILFNCYDITEIGKAWTYGHIDVQTNPHGGAFAYCVKYIDKEKTIPTSPNDDRIKEQSRMSQGLGLNYLTPEIIAWHKSDILNNNYVYYQYKKQAIPRYYKDRIYSNQEQNLIQEYTKILNTETDQYDNIDLEQAQKQARINNFNHFIKIRE